MQVDCTCPSILCNDLEIMGSLLKITLEYMLSRLSREELDKTVQEELECSEKIKALENINDTRIRKLLLKLGAKEDFLKTI